MPAKRVGNPYRLGINTAITGAVKRATGRHMQTCCHFGDRSEGGEEACSIPIVQALKRATGQRSADVSPVGSPQHRDAVDTARIETGQ